MPASLPLDLPAARGYRTGRCRLQGDVGTARRCGLALAFDDEKLSDLAGVLTPAAVMGEALPDRLRAAGMVIKVERT